MIKMVALESMKLSDQEVGSLSPSCRRVRCVFLLKHCCGWKKSSSQEASQFLTIFDKFSCKKAKFASQYQKFLSPNQNFQGLTQLLAHGQGLVFHLN